MDILSIIAGRVSTRVFQPEPARIEDLEAVQQAGKEAEALTRTEMRVHLCPAEQMEREVRGIIGDYGKTIRAPHYLVLASKEREGYLPDAGYRFEQVVLEATRRGLGTCWVGLMFKEASLRSALGLDESWRMIVISPIGNPLQSSIVNRMMRTLAGSKGRKPVEQIFFWQQHGAPLPPGVLADQKLMQVFHATRWAPSWMNRQPWRFVLTDSDVLIYKHGQQDREGKDYHRLDCGIAMCHFHFAAREMGIKGRWELGTFKVPGSPEAEPIAKYVLERAVLR